MAKQWKCDCCGDPTQKTSLRAVTVFGRDGRKPIYLCRNCNLGMWYESNPRYRKLHEEIMRKINGEKP